MTVSTVKKTINDKIKILQKEVTDLSNDNTTLSTQISANTSTISALQNKIETDTTTYNGLPTAAKLILDILRNIDTNIVNGIHELIKNNSINFRDSINPEVISNDGKIYIEL